MHARVIVLAGPSGSGKSRLAGRLGLPELRLDDFYKEGDDPTLPHVYARRWRAASSTGTPLRRGTPRAAVAAVEELCRTGRTDAPVYDIAASAATGRPSVDLAGSAYFVAEGIFAQEIVTECLRRGLVADAVCVTQHPARTFLRRLFAGPARAPQAPARACSAAACTCWPSSAAWSTAPSASAAACCPPPAAYDVLTGLVAGPV